MNTINTLRRQNEKLTKETNEMLLANEKLSLKFNVILFFMVITVVWLLWRNYGRPAATNI